MFRHSLNSVISPRLFVSGHSRKSNITDRVLRALADVTRRRILTLVWHGKRTAGQIAAEFPVSRPAISQHLSVLLTSELISVRRVGTRRLYRANRDALKRLRAQLGAFWDSRLEQLKDAAEAAERNRRRG